MLEEKHNEQTFGQSRRPRMEDDPLITLGELPSMGIYYHPTHLRKLWLADDFPKPFKLSPKKLAWRRSAILNWIKDREQASKEPKKKK